LAGDTLKHQAIKGIKMSTLSEASFYQTLEDCISGKILKEQALELLKSKHKSALIDIKQKFGKDRQSLCCYVPCDFDEWIKICDGSERSKPFPERKYKDDLIQRVIDKYAAECRKNDLESGDCVSEVYSEVNQIQNWCRENREITELYEKYKAEIQVLPETNHQQTGKQLDTPEKIQIEIDRTISILLKDNKIKGAKTKKGNIEYRISTLVPQLQTYLKMKKKNGIILLPEIENIDDFIIQYVKNKKGDSLYDAIRASNDRKKKQAAKIQNT
jgi:hypothetical protein